jgi:quercetin dioxygenase-like cupin family protein
MKGLIKRRKIDFSFEDERGYLKQISHENYGQVNVLFTKRGVKRGNHYHKVSTEYFFVISGSVNITVKQGEVIETEVFTSGDFFEISPNIIHSMDFIEDCIMVAMYDKCVEKSDGTKDIYTE